MKWDASWSMHFTNMYIVQFGNGVAFLCVCVYEIERSEQKSKISDSGGGCVCNNTRELENATNRTQNTQCIHMNVRTKRH